MPMVDALFIGYEIDMLFEYDDGEGATVNVWWQGKVVFIVNENTNVNKWQRPANTERKVA